jgi:hypothetical protein
MFKTQLKHYNQPVITKREQPIPIYPISHLSIPVENYLSMLENALLVPVVP